MWFQPFTEALFPAADLSLAYLVRDHYLLIPAGESSGFHHGVDIAGKIGDPIRAAASGEVTFTGYRPVYGRMVMVSQDDGGETLYAHVSEVHVSVGERVSSGQVIARVGNTGRSTGPHLHLEVKYGGKNHDPLKLLSF